MNYEPVNVVYNITPKVKITFEVVFVIDKPKTFVRDLMLVPKTADSITYYQPIYTCDPFEVPDYSNVLDWNITGEDYTVDILKPFWHNDWEDLVEALKERYYTSDMPTTFKIIGGNDELRK